ncbi:hypothetical protein AAF712_001787 [Marasmius tenuissimus]|uniref:Protein kinase domain-containing protein n=1 Tax=Marasmius tenuissimus TaxID=585030 RepID=A0ABR3ACX6_9AGAR
MHDPQLSCLVPAGSVLLQFRQSTCNSRPLEQDEYREVHYRNQLFLSSSPESELFQSKLTSITPNPRLLDWEPLQNSPVPSFFSPEAFSTPKITIESRISIPSPPLLPDDVPSISDECSSPLSDTASSPVKNSLLSFGIIGALRSGECGKVLLGHSGGPSGARTLHAIKVLRKDGLDRYGVEEVKRELRTLRVIAEVSRLQEDSVQGVGFLQTMSESFQNDRYVVIVSDYLPVSLAEPKTAARFRLEASSPINGLSVSASLPLVFPSACLQCDSANTMASFRLLAAELVLALRFLHQNGIIHQDVKPGNVMVSAEGHIVLGDFGASAALPFSMEYDDFPVGSSADASATKMYQPVVLQGDDIVTFTPRYAAPELLCRNDADLVVYDERVDWFSCGVVLYELATGALPFQADLLKEIPQSRRSVGDFSLAFGDLERLINATIGCEHASLEAFLKALLAHHASDRLSGEDVKLHPFFDPVSSLWDEISAMEHPPLPCPTLPFLESDISSSTSGGTLKDLQPLCMEDSMVIDDLFREAGLRITCSSDNAKCSSNDGARAVEEEANLDGLKYGAAFDVNPAGSPNLGCALDHKHRSSIEDISEIQPFPSTASIIFPSKEQPFPAGPSSSQATKDPLTTRSPRARRLVPSFCSVHDSGVDMSCDADISSSLEADMSTNIDFEEVTMMDMSRNIPSPVQQYETMLSPSLAYERLLLPQSTKQRQPLRAIRNEISRTSLPRSPTTSTARRSTRHMRKFDLAGSCSTISEDKPSGSPRNRRLSEPIPSPRSRSTNNRVQRPSIPPVSHSNNTRASASPLVTIGPSNPNRPRRSSLPVQYKGHTTPKGYAKRTSFAAYRGVPDEFGVASSPRSRRISESWTLEEELTISVLNAMDFPRDIRHFEDPAAGRSTMPRSRRDSYLGGARRATLSVFGSIRGRDSCPADTERITPIVPQAAIEVPQTQKRRLSILTKRQKPTSLLPSQTETGPSSPRKALGGFFKRLKRLSGL